MLPIILALDTKDLDLASKWIKSSADQIDHFKVGLEYYRDWETLPLRVKAQWWR